MNHNDPSPERGPESQGERLVLLILGLAFGGMLLWEIFSDYSLAKLSVVFFAASWVVLLVIHEMGHALMARAVGWRVELVSIGTGKVRYRRTIFGMETEFRTIPLSGFMRPRPLDLIAPQLKLCLIYAAGPGIELLLVAVIAVGVDFSNLMVPSQEPGMIALQSFCVAAVFGAVTNLIPLSHQSAGKTAASDGLGMIACWSLPLTHFDNWMRGR